MSKWRFIGELIAIYPKSGVAPLVPPPEGYTVAGNPFVANRDLPICDNRKNDTTTCGDILICALTDSVVKPQQCLICDKI